MRNALPSASTHDSSFVFQVSWPLGKLYIRAECAARSTRENLPCIRISAFAERNRNSTASFAEGDSSTSTDCSRILPRIYIVKDFDNTLEYEVQFSRLIAHFFFFFIDDVLCTLMLTYFIFFQYLIIYSIFFIGIFQNINFVQVNRKILLYRKFRKLRASSRL